MCLLRKYQGFELYNYSCGCGVIAAAAFASFATSVQTLLDSGYVREGR